MCVGSPTAGISSSSRLPPDNDFETHKSPVPPQDGVGCHDAGDGREVTPAEDVAFHGETASLVVAQAQLSGTVHCAEDPILLEQVVNDRLLGGCPARC